MDIQYIPLISLVLWLHNNTYYENVLHGHTFRTNSTRIKKINYGVRASQLQVHYLHISVCIYIYIYKYINCKKLCWLTHQRIYFDEYSWFCVFNDFEISAIYEPLNVYFWVGRWVQSHRKIDSRCVINDFNVILFYLIDKIFYRKLFND